MSLDVTLSCHNCGSIRFESNITHNLNLMAEEAGLYGAVWRPEENGVFEAHQLIPILEAGIALMKSDPARFEAFNAKNGWGLYENFLPWLERYLEACRQHPNATVSVSR